ncbi:hypothetical protein [uncultured Roseibium sp.]|uniref:hypothetical protein n=1 Tax=uncultured Roseibium sp. TaxID=1936171 RepID=UPI003217B8F5
MVKFGAVSLFLLMSVCAHAQVSAPAGDYYIRSLDPSGRFNGIQEILTRPETGYHKAVYCETSFWVTRSTVVWTEREAEAGRHLVIINEVNKRPEVYCADPEHYVRLEDLGLEKHEILKARDNAEPVDMQSSRLRTISEAFKNFK